MQIYVLNEKHINEIKRDWQPVPLGSPLFVCKHSWRKDRWFGSVFYCRHCRCFKIGKDGKVLIELFLLPPLYEDVSMPADNRKDS